MAPPRRKWLDANTGKSNLPIKVWEERGQSWIAPATTPIFIISQTQNSKREINFKIDVVDIASIVEDGKSDGYLDLTLVNGDGYVRYHLDHETFRCRSLTTKECN